MEMPDGQVGQAVPKWYSALVAHQGRAMRQRACNDRRTAKGFANPWSGAAAPSLARGAGKALLGATRAESPGNGRVRGQANALAEKDSPRASELQLPAYAFLKG